MARLGRNGAPVTRDVEGAKLIGSAFHTSSRKPLGWGTAEKCQLVVCVRGLCAASDEARKSRVPQFFKGARPARGADIPRLHGPSSAGLASISPSTCWHLAPVSGDTITRPSTRRLLLSSRVGKPRSGWRRPRPRAFNGTLPSGPGPSSQLMCEVPTPHRAPRVPRARVRRGMFA